jgi:hypothetical protein
VDPEKRLNAAHALKHPLFSRCTRIVPEPQNLRTPVRAVVPHGVWAKTRYDIIKNIMLDLAHGFVQYVPALIAIHIFDRCAPILEQHKEHIEITPNVIHHCFCATYMIALKLTVDLPDPMPDIFKMTKGVVCGSSDSDRINVLFLERIIVRALQFHFGVQDILAMPVTPSIFKTLLKRPLVHL